MQLYLFGANCQIYWLTVCLSMSLHQTNCLLGTCLCTFISTQELNSLFVNGSYISYFWRLLKWIGRSKFSQLVLHGCFGKLNTQDRHATGNYGLKDILLAHKWVNKNIHKFGGKFVNFGFLMPCAIRVCSSSVYSKDAKGLIAKTLSPSGLLFNFIQSNISRRKPKL